MKDLLIFFHCLHAPSFNRKVESMILFIVLNNIVKNESFFFSYNLFCALFLKSSPLHLQTALGLLFFFSSVSLLQD